VRFGVLDRVTKDGQKAPPVYSGRKVVVPLPCLTRPWNGWICVAVSGVVKNEPLERPTWRCLDLPCVESRDRGFGNAEGAHGLRREDYFSWAIRPTVFEHLRWRGGAACACFILDRTLSEVKIWSQQIF
jgi:hypothetical protein